MGKLFFVLGLGALLLSSTGFAKEPSLPNSTSNLNVKFWVYPLATQMQWLDSNNQGSVIFFMEYDEHKIRITNFEVETTGALTSELLRLKTDKRFLIDTIVALQLSQVKHMGLFGEGQVDPLVNKGKKKEDRIIALFDTITSSQFRFIIKKLETQKDVDLYLIKILLDGLLERNINFKITPSKSMCENFLLN